MNVFDIILLIILGWAAYRGFRDGVIVQLGGIAGLFIGVYLAFRFGPVLGRWIGTGDDFSAFAGFAIVLIVVIIAIAVISRLLSKLFSAAGLGILNKLGGIVLALLKAGLIIGLLLYCFDFLNRKGKWVNEESLEKSALYTPLIGVAEYAFPYIDFIKDKLLDIPEGNTEKEEDDTEDEITTDTVRQI